MNNPVTLLAWGTPVAVAVCVISYIQRRHWQAPPASREEAARRETWQLMWPYPQFGVRVRDDGHVYTNGTGRYLGPAAGAQARLVDVQRITTIKPSTGWAVIYFADGTHHRQRYALSRRGEAQAQADRFNRHAKPGSPGPAVFKRTFTPDQAALTR